MALAIAISACGKSEQADSGAKISPKTAPQSAGNPQPASGTKSGSQPNSTVETTSSAAAGNDSAGGGALSGIVSLTGTVPELEALVKQGDTAVKDSQVCGLHDIPDESLIVNRSANNAVAGVFIYLVKSPSKSSTPAPTEPVLLDQKGCRFLPHTAVVRVGQPVHFLSDDPVAHNVHTFPTRNAAFNQTVSASSREGITLVYKSFEVEPVEIKCDIHPWMRAYQLIIDHPFAAVTDESGNFTIDNLPPGTHTFRIWHERGRLLERDYKVDIQAGETKEVEIQFPAEKFLAGGQ